MHSFFVYACSFMCMGICVPVHVCACACVCLCVCVPVHVCACACLCLVHVKVRSQLRCHLHCSLPNFETSFLTELELTNSASLAGQRAPGILVSTSLVLRTQGHTAMPGFDAGVPNSGPHALLTETSPLSFITVYTLLRPHCC